MKRRRVAWLTDQQYRALQRMAREERLVAYANHAQLMNQMYQADVRYRSGLLPSLKIFAGSPKDLHDAAGVLHAVHAAV